MTLFEMEIPYPPMAAPRPRFSRRGGFVRVHNEPDYDVWKTAVSMYAASEYKGPLLGEPILFCCFFRLQKPKSAPKNRLYPIVRPDLDNYVKAVKDSLSGVIWKDDNLICALVAQKVYLKDPTAPSNLKISVRGMPSEDKSN